MLLGPTFAPVPVVRLKIGPASKNGLCRSGEIWSLMEPDRLTADLGTAEVRATVGETESQRNVKSRGRFCRLSRDRGGALHTAHRADCGHTSSLSLSRTTAHIENDAAPADRNGRSGRIRRYLAWSAIVGIVLIALPIAASAWLSTGRMASRSWFWQNPLPIGNTISGLSFSTDDDGWAVGADGSVLHTLNGGSSWMSVDAGADTDWAGVHFASSARGWVVGKGGAIRTTGDGGASWAAQDSGTSAHLRGIAFADADNGIAIGDAAGGTSTIRYTTSGGTTWGTGRTTSAASLNAVAMASPTLAWAVGSSGTMLKSVDGGSTWTAANPQTSASINGIAFAPGTATGYAVGNATGSTFNVFKTTDGANWTRLSLPGAGVSLLSVACSPDGSRVSVAGEKGSVYHSDDGGATWTRTDPAGLSSVTLRAVAVRGTHRLNAAGDSGTLLFSRDRGASWLSDPQRSKYDILDASFINANTGWAVGQQGLLMRTTDAGVTWNGKKVGSGTLRGVFFRDASLGWVVGDDGLIRKTTDGGATWTSQTTPVSGQYNDVSFVGDTTGWIVGNGGAIFKTTDGGASWTKQTSGTTAALRSVSFSSATRGWAVGDNGVILTTGNGGTTWTRQSSGTNLRLNEVYANDDLRVMVVGDLGTGRRTVDGGRTWQDMSAALGTTQNLTAVYMADSSNAWVGGTGAFLKRTTNGGSSFTAQNPGLPNMAADGAVAIESLYFKDVDRGFLLGGSGEIRKTTNGGGVWTPYHYGTLSSLSDIVRTDADTLWAVGAAGAVVNSHDGGYTWFQQDSLSTLALRGVTMANADTGFVVGQGGAIRRTSDGGWTWASQSSGTTSQLNAVDTVDGTNVVAVGNGIALWTSTSGTTWTASAALPTDRQVNDVQMLSATDGWAVASAGGASTIFKTIDGGATWTSAFDTAGIGFDSVFFRPSGVLGWACGPEGRVYRTADSGATWTATDTGVTEHLTQVAFTDDDIGWAIGADGTVLRTSDGGDTWVRQDSGTSTDLAAGTFTGTHDGWIVGTDGALLRGFDQNLPVTTLIATPAASDGLNGWYVSRPSIQLLLGSAGNIRYSFDSDTGPWETYTEPFLVPEGTTTLYYYAEDLEGTEEAVRSADFTVDITPPSAPTNASLSAITSTGATVSWTAGTDALSGVAGYRVYVGGVPQTASDTHLDLVGLNPNTTYEVYVVTLDAAGQVSGRSNTLALTTADDGVAPLGTAAVVNPAEPDGEDDWYVSTPSITLTAIPETVPSVVYYSTDTTTGVWSVYGGPLAAQSGAHTYYYYSQSTSGTVRPIEYHAVSIKADPFAVPAPADLDGVATGPNSVDLTWTGITEPVSGLARYEIYVNGEYKASTTATTHTLVGLEASTSYTFAVRAVSNAGALSPETTLVTLSTLAPPRPDAPRIVYARAVDGAAAYIDWEPRTDTVGTTSYRVWRSPDGVDYDPIATVTDPNRNSYVDATLSSGTRYWYAVTTIDYRGESDLGTAPAALTNVIAGPPPRPSILEAVGTPGQVMLAWAPLPNAGVTGYYVTRGTASLSTVTTLTPVPVTGTSFFDFDVETGVSYWYAVRAVDATGSIGPASAERMATSAYPTEPEAAPHGTPEDRRDDCAGCHRGHSATSRNILRPLVDKPVDPALDEEEQAQADAAHLCMSCHSAGSLAADVATGVRSETTVSRHVVGPTDEGAGLYCDDCHSAHRSNDAEADPRLLDVNGVTASNDVCYGCHGEDSTLGGGDLRVFEDSAHAINDAPSEAGITCNRCHMQHTSPNEQLLTYSRYMLCVQCHTSDNPPRYSDILSRMTAVPEDSTTRHDFTTADQAANGTRIACQNCHNSMALTSSAPLVDPENPSTSAAWTGSQIRFCVRCHDGELPGSAQTEPWVAAPLSYGGSNLTKDISSAYETNAHGFGDSTDEDVHLKPEMGYTAATATTPGDILTCSTCHDGHGTVNSFTLKDRITSADGQVAREGLTVVPIDGGGYDLRFFCASCHDFTPASHAANADITAFPTDCTASGCHRHTSKPVGPQPTNETGTTF